MLTTVQHHSSACLTDPQARQVYAMHMCGLCQALGEQYGLLSCLVTSHELTLLNLLTSAQHSDEPIVVKRHCPLNPLRTVATNRDVASRYASAVAIGLAYVKFTDDVEDSGGRNVAARLCRSLARRPHQAALQVLQDLKIDRDILGRLSEEQTRAEMDGSQDPAGPSALASARLFSWTARLAGIPENIERLAVTGAQFGTYIYLQDAYHDFAGDMLRGEYNPLRRFCQRSSRELALSQSGLEWLLSRLETIQASLHENVPKLYLHRYRELIAEMLCSPVDRLALEVSRRARQDKLSFVSWHWLDVLKAGVFIVPPLEPQSTLTGAEMAYAHGDRGPGEQTDESEKEPEYQHQDPCFPDYCQCNWMECWSCEQLPFRGLRWDLCCNCGNLEMDKCCGHGLSSADFSGCSGSDCDGGDCSGPDCGGGGDCGGADCGGADCGGGDCSGCG